MAFLDSRTFRILFATAFALAVFAVVVTGWWVSTYVLPIREVQNTVRGRLPGGESATFEHVTFHKATRVGCGYVRMKKPDAAETERTQFILFGDGRLLLPPVAPTGGDAAQQIAALEAQAEYSKSVVAHCLR